MYMTQEADNAVRIVYNIAMHGKRRDAKSIAEETHVSLRFSLKILRKLVEKGIVKSFMGKYGGYELAKPPEDISLGEVIRAVDGPYMMTRCLKDDHICTAGDGCEFRDVFAELSDMMTEKLDGRSFSEFL